MADLEEQQGPQLPQEQKKNLEAWNIDLGCHSFPKDMENVIFR